MNGTVYLVGDTGFVGSNLLKHNSFTQTAHSTNVTNMYAARPDVLIYAGVTGTKWYANGHPKEDMAVIDAAIKNIREIAARKLVLISTVDIYDCLSGVDESRLIDPNNLCIYGKHRYMLETWVRENVSDYNIIRLPAIYGNHLKKNFLFDMIHFVPHVLKREFYEQISCEMSVKEFYEQNQEGDYILKSLSATEYLDLRARFRAIHSNSMLFTNSESKYQFYNLRWLWEEIVRAVNYGIREINIVTEPVSAAEVFNYVYGESFENHAVSQICYDIRTKYCEIMGGRCGYLYDKKCILEDIKRFVDEYPWGC